MDLPTECEYYVKVDSLRSDAKRSTTSTSLRTRGNIHAQDAVRIFKSGALGSATGVGASAISATHAPATTPAVEAQEKDEAEQKKREEEERKKLEKKRKAEEKKEAEKKRREDEKNCPYNKGAKFAASLWNDIGNAKATIVKLADPAQSEGVRSTATGLAERLKDNVEKMTSAWTEITNSVDKQSGDTLAVAMQNAVEIVREHQALNRMAEALLGDDEATAAKKAKKA